MKVGLVCAWYDIWIGAYWDRKNGRLYLLPLSMLGIWVEFAARVPRTGVK